MDQRTAVDKVLRDLIERELIFEEERDRVRKYLDALWVCGWEYYRRYETHHDANVREVEYFGRNNEKLGTFPSIAEAERVLKIPRKTIYNTLSSRFKRMRSGHYFKYAQDENNSGSIVGEE
jgi:hypothetical protein